MSDAYLEGLMSEVEKQQGPVSPELRNSVLGMLEERFTATAIEMQGKKPGDDVSPAVVYRLAKGLECLVQLLKQS